MRVTAADLFIPFAVVAQVEEFLYPAVQVIVVEVSSKCVVSLLDAGVTEQQVIPLDQRV